jgi:hypothetical protein
MAYHRLNAAAVDDLINSNLGIITEDATERVAIYQPQITISNSFVRQLDANSTTRISAQRIIRF